MQSLTKLELLAPAKDLECGKAAIDHGADAVYIGAPRFGARADAGNCVGDIRELCRYAHLFEAKVYVTVNTLIYNDELDDTRQLLHELADAEVDAVLVQEYFGHSNSPSHDKIYPAKKQFYNATLHISLKK